VLSLREEADNLDEEKEKHPDWRDYFALSIASLQTILLPFLICIIVLLALLLVFR